MRDPAVQWSMVMVIWECTNALKESQTGVTIPSQIANLLKARQKIEI
jgi:hypothetical protein